jgi:hypothetical protein
MARPVGCAEVNAIGMGTALRPRSLGFVKIGAFSTVIGEDVSTGRGVFIAFLIEYRYDGPSGFALRLLANKNRSLHSARWIGAFLFCSSVREAASQDATERNFRVQVVLSPHSVWII